MADSLAERSLNGSWAAGPEPGRARAAARLRAAAPLLMILPGLVLALFIIGYPVVELIRGSVHDISKFGVMRAFSGLENYRDMAADPEFWAAFRRTLVWTFGVVAGTLLISVPVALILNDDFIGRDVARILVMLPWAVSLTMTAVVWRWALDGDAGLLNATLIDLGLIDRPVIWLAEASLAFPAEIAIGILVSIPFTVTVLLGGLSSVPQDVYEAAAVDGAGRWSQFTTITLPLLKPFLNIAVVLNIIYVFNSFPIIWVLTKGGPANTTDILVTYLYKLAFVFGRLGEAAAVSVVMFAALLAFVLVYVRLAARGGEEQGA